MSGIYIPGAALPEMCQECIFDVCAICELTNEKNNLVEIGKRRSDCPLVPVPPHGRLIEVSDAIETAWMILRGLDYLKEENPKLEQTVREVFATAPAIEVE